MDTNKTLHAAFEVHNDNILTNGMATCPVPSCSSHLLTCFDLLYHMISFHWIPIFGSTKHTSVRWLHLPPINKEVSTAPGTAPGTSIDAIGDVIGGDKTDVDAIDVDTDTSESEVVWGKRRRYCTTTGTNIDMIDGMQSMWTWTPLYQKSSEAKEKMCWACQGSQLVVLWL